MGFSFLSFDPAAVAHINHIRKIAGVDHVGLGAGYDGISRYVKGKGTKYFARVSYLNFDGMVWWNFDTDYKFLSY